MPLFVNAIHAALLAAALLVPGESTVSTQSVPIDEIVAIVNGSVITRRDVDEKVGQGTIKSFGQSDAEKEQLWYQMLLELVVDTIKLQAAKKRDLAVQSNYVADEIEKRRAGRTEAEFRDIVDQLGFFTLDEYQESLENEQLEKLFWWTQWDDRMSRAPKQRPSRGIEPRPEEVRAYYNANKERYRVPERARVSLITVSASKVGSREAALAIAAELREKIEAGADFAELARLHSSTRADEGGDLGWIEKDSEDYLQAIRDFAFSAKPGTLSPVIPSGNVALLLRQDGHELEKVRDFGEVSHEIRAQLKNQKFEKLFSDIVSDLISEAYIYPPILKERLLGISAARAK